jgi:integrase
MEEKKERKQRKRGNAEGSIYRMSDGRWAAAVTIGKNANGKPKRKVYVANTRHAVSDRLTDALKDLKLGLPIVSDRQSVAKYLEHWLEHVTKSRVRRKTQRTYSDLVRLHITPGLGSIPLGKLSPQNVREFLNAKLAAGLSSRTVKHLLVTLRGALAVAAKDGQIPRNVAALVDPPRVARTEVQAFNPEQAREFLNAVQGSRLKAAYTVAVAVGMRQGEILGLQWSDIDMEAGTLRIRAALQRVEKKLVRVEPKSPKSSRPIQLPAVCVSALVRHKAQQDEDRKWAGTRWQETGFVFTTRIGTPMDPRDLLRDYYRITRPKPEKEGMETLKLAFPPIRFHDLRHSAATLLLAQGVSARYITELLGHSQVSFTLQTYAHVLPEVQEQVATKMDEILGQKPAANTVANKPLSTRPS